MHTPQASVFRNRSQQGGFTLIELIVVIVILGVLAATALPKFADLGSDARVAKMQGARASVLSAANMFHGRWLAAGSPSTGTPTYDGVAIDPATGYPTTAGIAAAVSLTDYDTTDFGTGVLYVDSSHKSCKLTYSAAAATGPSVVMAVAAADC